LIFQCFFKTYRSGLPQTTEKIKYNEGMKQQSRIAKIFGKSEVLRSPKHRLSTFGNTQIEYFLVTNVTGYPDRSRIRRGFLKTERPQIITPETIGEKFQGFGREAQKYVEWLAKKYGQTVKSLGYDFRNEPTSSRIELMLPDRTKKKLSEKIDREAPYHVALLSGLDKYWELSLMKFIVEETLSSFSTNVKELNERGFFEGEDRHIQRKHREIQNLIKLARTNEDVVPTLGQKLKEYGLFEHYQDDFFRLVKT